jgi:hypothetical protein
MLSPVSTCCHHVATVWQRSEALVLCDILMYVATVATKSPQNSIRDFSLQIKSKNILYKCNVCIVEKVATVATVATFISLK